MDKVNCQTRKRIYHYLNVTLSCDGVKNKSLTESHAKCLVYIVMHCDN